MQGEQKKRGRPAKLRLDVSREAIRAVREIVKEYPRLKLVCEVVPKKRASLFAGMNVSTEHYEATGRIDYNREVIDRIPATDKAVITGYELNMWKIWILEHGVASITDERTRAIADDTLLRGKPVMQLLNKYGIGRRQLFWEKKNAVKAVAVFISFHKEN